MKYGIILKRDAFDRSLLDERIYLNRLYVLFVYLLYLFFASNAIMRGFTLSVCSRPVNNRAKADEALI